MAARSSFNIEIVQRDGVDHVSLAGVIDENADLALLGTLGSRPIRVNLRGVRRINSFGVRAWMDVIRKIPRDTALNERLDKNRLLSPERRAQRYLAKLDREAASA